MITNKMIYIPILVWASIQVFKVICDFVKTRKFNFKRLMGAGGMPSSHSAVVCCLAVLIGKDSGFDSSIFALSVVFAMVVMYDACGVRRAAGNQARLLNKLIETQNLSLGETTKKLTEILGHTPIQVFVGAIIGIIVGNVV